MPSKTPDKYGKDIESLGKKDPAVARFLDSASDFMWDESERSAMSNNNSQRQQSTTTGKRSSFMKDNSYPGSNRDLEDSNSQLVQRERSSLVSLNVADSSRGIKAKSLWKPREKKVDQSVNLMDADANVYERKGKDGAALGRQDSLEDIFLASDHEKDRMSIFNKSFGSLQKKIQASSSKTTQARCLRMLTALLVLAICASLAAVAFPKIYAGHIALPSFAGFGKDDSNDSNSEPQVEELNLVGRPTYDDNEAEEPNLVGRPTYNDNEDEEPNLVGRPTYNDNEEEDSEIVERPTYNDNEEDGTDIVERPTYSDNEEEGTDIVERPTYSDNGNAEEPPADDKTTVDRPDYGKDGDEDQEEETNIVQRPNYEIGEQREEKEETNIVQRPSYVTGEQEVEEEETNIVQRPSYETGGEN